MKPDPDMRPGLLARNLPVAAMALIIATCVAADVFVARRPEIALSALPLAAATVALAWGVNRRARPGGEDAP